MPGVLSMLAVALLVVFAMPHTARAQGPTNADPKLTTAYEAAFDAMYKDPGNLDLTFRYAELAIQVGDYEGAIGALERMLLINPNLPRVRLELGVLYFRLGSYAIARTYLESALAAKDVPDLVKTRVAKFLAEIESRQSAHRLSGSVLGGLRYQSNANAGPSSTGVLVGGVPAELDEQFTAQDDFNAFAALDLNHSYDFQAQSGTAWETDLLLYGSKQREENQLDLLFGEFKTGPRFYPEMTDGLGRTTVRPYALLNYVFLDDSRLFAAYGGGIEITKAVSQALQGIFTYQAKKKNFHADSTRTTAQDMNGVEHSARLQLNASIDANSGLIGAAGVKDQNAKQDFEAYREYAASLSYVRTFPAPFGWTAAPWNAALTAEFSYSRYDSPDVTVDPNQRRIDRKRRLALTGSVPVADQTALVFTLSRIVSNSTLPNFDYNNTALSVAARYRF